jgi:ComF family protein
VWSPIVTLSTCIRGLARVLGPFSRLSAFRSAIYGVGHLSTAIWKVLGWLASACADLLESPHCAGCDEPLRRRALWCVPCSASLLEAPCGAFQDGENGGGVPIHAFGLYGGALAQALQRLKYRGRPDLAHPLGGLLRRSSVIGKLTVDLIVPVPLHPRRLARRGFNQAALLARPVAERLTIPIDPWSLERIVDTAPQAELDGESRRRNVRDAFEVRRPRRVVGKRVLLIDDVATTGATLSACAAALRRAGAVDVQALVVARAVQGLSSTVVTA